MTFDLSRDKHNKATMISLNRLMNDDDQRFSHHSSLEKFCFSSFDTDEQSQLKNSGFKFYSGKVRDCLYKDKDIYMVHSDRLSVFDRIVGQIPFKGSLLTHINHFWLKTCRNSVPVCNFSKIGNRTIKMDHLKNLKFEVIVRGFLAGSMMKAYNKGERVFSGYHLPDGLCSWQKLPSLMITPTTKAAVGEHDEPITAEEIIKTKLCTSSQWDQIHKISLDLFTIGQEIYNSRGWILVDTKYEFGVNSKGDVFLIDEIHTPDSSRLWVEKTYKERLENSLEPEMLDKEIIRSYLSDKGFGGNGEIPEIPLQKIISLSRTYFHVAEKLLNEEIFVSRSSIEEKNNMLKYLLRV